MNSSDKSQLPLLKNSSIIKFIIFGQGRNGGTLLINLLNQHPDIACDREIFNIDYYGMIDDPIKHATKLSIKAKSRAYGFKLKVYQFSEDQGYGNYLEIIKDFSNTGWKFIYTKRSNILKQAFSNHFANANKVFHVKDRNRIKNQMIKMDPKDLLRGVTKRERYLEEERIILEGIPYHLVEYEKDLLFRENHQKTVNRVFNFLGLHSVPVRAKIAKSTSTKFSDNISNWDEVVEVISDTKYAHLLNDL